MIVEHCCFIIFLIVGNPWSVSLLLPKLRYTKGKVYQRYIRQEKRDQTMYFSMPWSWYLNNRIHCLTFSFVTSIFYNKYCTREDILVHVYILSETPPPSFSVCPWKNQQSTLWWSSYLKTWIIMSQIHHRTVLSFKV